MTTMLSRPTSSTSMPSTVTSDAPNSRPAGLRPTPTVPAPGGSDSPATIEGAKPNLSSSRGFNVPGPAAIDGTHTGTSTLLDPALCLAADVLDDLERVRTANENRVRQLTRTAADADGEERGFGLDPGHRDVVRLAEIVDNLKRLEHEATLELQRRLRKHPLGAWVKATKGVGEKQGARLLAAIGDPYINSATGQPRTVSALWAYSGLHVLPGGQTANDAQSRTAAGGQRRDTDHGDRDDQRTRVGVAAKRRKGERANWSGKAKMRAYLIAESCMKQIHQDCRDGHHISDAQAAGAVPAQTPQTEGGHPANAPQGDPAASVCGCSPYRVVYDARRAHTATTHPEWTDGHSHNDALRVASKAILRDLWRAARDWHKAQEATP